MTTVDEPSGIGRSAIGRFDRDPTRSFTIPSYLYTDPAVLRAERERIFWRSWIFVCHVSEVAEVGSYFGAEIADQRVFVVRNEQDALRCFFNVCQHRGHQLVEGSGVVRGLITCPYHAWAYDTDGSLRGARLSDRMEGFEHAEFSLQEVALEVFHGLVFVNLDRTADPMSEVYPGLSEAVGALSSNPEDLVRTAETVYDIAGNWKNVGDNLLECYHCNPAHPDFVELIDMSGYINECHDNWSIQSGPSRADNGVYDIANGAAGFASIYVWPNLSIGQLPGHRGIFIFRFMPTEAERTKQELIYFGPEAEPSPTETDALAFFNDVLGPEDVALVESVQVGLRSLGYDQGRFICIPDRPEISEHAVHHFHTMVLDALELA